MYKRNGFSNILIGIIAAILLIGAVGIGMFVTKRSNNPLSLSTEQTTNPSSDNRTTPTPTPIPVPAPKTLPSAPVVTPPVKPTPAPTTKPTPAPTPVPTPPPPPPQSQKTSSISDVFVMQDDGTLVQSGNIVDVEAVSRKFYSLYPNKDNYNFLNIFTTFVDTSKPHLHYMVRSDVQGIGRDTDNTSNLFSVFGSKKLLGVNFFSTTFTADQLNSTAQSIKSNLNIIDHELSHQWLMYIGNSFGFKADDGVHYGRWANTSFTRDGEGWVDTNGGFVWKDNQNGTLSIPDSSFSARRGFSKLSLYFMGLLSSSDVPDLEVVVPKDPTDKISRTIVGTFKKVSIDNITTKYGDRNPSYQNSQKNFRMAYILLSKKGETPAQYQLDAINYIAQNYPGWWNFVTYGKSTINQ